MKTKPLDAVKPIMLRALRSAIRLIDGEGTESGQIFNRETGVATSAIIVVKGEAATAEILAAVRAVENGWGPKKGGANP